MPSLRVEDGGSERTVVTEGRLTCSSPLCCVSGAVSYTLLYNCLDFPAGVVPVTTVTAEDEAQLQLYKDECCQVMSTEARSSRKFGKEGEPVHRKQKNKINKWAYIKSKIICATKR